MINFIIDDYKLIQIEDNPEILNFIKNDIHYHVQDVEYNNIGPTVYTNVEAIIYTLTQCEIIPTNLKALTEIKKIFVYGTLKSRYHNRYLLKNNNFKEVKVNNYALVSRGFPVAFVNYNTHIIGELYNYENTPSDEYLDILVNNLDILEGFNYLNNWLYKRTLIEIDNELAFLYQVSRKDAKEFISNDNLDVNIISEY